MCALEANARAGLPTAKVCEVPLRPVLESAAQGHGIGRGCTLLSATLRFSPAAARRLGAEVRRRMQQGSDLPDRGCEPRRPHPESPGLGTPVLRRGGHVGFVERMPPRRKIVVLPASAAARCGG